MPWVKKDDRSWSHPKLVEAGLAAHGLDDRAICWSSSHGTDGFIPEAMLGIIAAGDRTARRLADRLVKVGRWERDEDRGGWWIHDFLEYNPSKADADAERAAARERMAQRRRSPDGSFAGRSGEHPGNGARSSPRRSPTPSRPVPKPTSRPQTGSARRRTGRPDETKSEARSPEVSKLGERMAEFITSSGGKPTGEVFDVAAWALAGLDFGFADQLLGGCMERNGKPRSARYFATALADQASAAGVDLAPYRRP